MVSFFRDKPRGLKLAGFDNFTDWLTARLKDSPQINRAQAYKYWNIGHTLLGHLSGDELSHIRVLKADMLAKVVNRIGHLPSELREAAFSRPWRELRVMADAFLPKREGAEPTIEDLHEVTHLSVEELKDIDHLLRKKKQIIFEGPPGSGKTFVADKFARYITGNPLDEERHDGRIEIVQFHQSYGYEDFVQGIRPSTAGTGGIRYEVKPGVFMRLCREAEEDKAGRPFVMIIDEINRGNISRVFGEVLFLLEYRDTEIALPYEGPGGKKFSIPQNVYLIGTMNTTDRSLAQIDYALRRRFCFCRLMPVVEDKAPILEAWLRSKGVAEEAIARVTGMFVQLNSKIREVLGEHLQIGHSYFMDPEIGTEASLTLVWKHDLMPLLEEYLYNNRKKDEIVAQIKDLFDKSLTVGGPSTS
jgi:5-methylcytosine-specific restriction protein B